MKSALEKPQPILRLCLSVTLAEIVVIFLWSEESLSLFEVALFHTLAMGCFFFFSKKWLSDPFVQFFRYLSPLLPLFGPLIVTSAIIEWRIRRPFATTFIELYYQLFDIFPSDESRALKQNANTMSDFNQTHALVSFQDIMQFGTDIQKNVAIGRILNHYKHEFSSALLVALKSDTSVIRVRAATAIAKLEDGFFEKEQRFLEGLKLEPNHTVTMENLLELYITMSLSLFIDIDRRRDVQHQALKVVERLFELAPERKSQWLEYKGSILENLGQHEEALESLLQAIEGKTSIRSWILLKALFSAAFILRKYDLIREITLNHSFPVFEDHRDDVFLWQELVGLWRLGAMEPLYPNHLKN